MSVTFTLIRKVSVGPSNIIEPKYPIAALLISMLEMTVCELYPLIRIGKIGKYTGDVIFIPWIPAFLLLTPDITKFVIPSMLLVTVKKVESGPAPAMLTNDLKGIGG